MNGDIAYSILPNRKGDETVKLITISPKKPERCFPKQKKWTLAKLKEGWGPFFWRLALDYQRERNPLVASTSLQEWAQATLKAQP